MQPNIILMLVIGFIESMILAGCFVYVEIMDKADSFMDLWPIWGTTLLMASFAQIAVMYPLRNR